MLEQVSSLPKTVSLKDGTPVKLRPMVAADEADLIRLFAGATEKDLMFLRDNVTDPRVIRRWCENLDYARVLPLVAEVGDEIVAEGTLHRKPTGPYPDVAKYRVYVREDFRNRGLSLMMLSQMVDIARDLGIAKIVMEIFTDDTGLVAAAERHGFIREAVLPAYHIVVVARPIVSNELKQFVPPVELWPRRIYHLYEFQQYEETFNITEELLDKNVAAGIGDKPAILFGDQAFTYGEVLDTVNRLASGLSKLGIGEGDRVIIRSGNNPQAIMFNFAVQRLGAMSIPTSPLFARTEIVHVAKDAQASAVICFGPMLEELEAALPDAPTVKHVVVFGGNLSGMAEKGYATYPDLVKNSSPDFSPVKRHRHDPAVLLYTSGTTGLPKGTLHLNEEQLIVPDAFGKYGWRVRPDDIIGGSAPIGFGAGYSTFCTIPYRFGATASLTGRFTPDGMFETIEKHRVTILTMAPTAYRKMLQLPEAAQKYDLSSLRVCTGGGEALTAPTYHAWKERFGLDIFEGFGSTEMFYVFVSNVANMKAKPGSFGQVINGYEAKVVDDEGNEVPSGTMGRFIARGPTATLYWNMGEKQASSIDKNGWNRVGDFVYRDEDGYFWFVSREDDIIKTSGYRVGPEEVEETLKEHPAVADAGVIGVPDPVRGQNTKAFIVLAAGQTAEPKELIDFCRSKIAVYKLPREVEFVDELPRTVTGKLLRRVLRAKEQEEREA